MPNSIELLIYTELSLQTRLTLWQEPRTNMLEIHTLVISIKPSIATHKIEDENQANHYKKIFSTNSTTKRKRQHLAEIKMQQQKPKSK